MAIYVEWSVVSGQFSDQWTATATAGVPDDAVDWTSRAQQIEVSTSCGVGQYGGSSAQIVLDNSDGAFTPFGGGIYEDWDWLANPVWVYGSSGTNPASLTQQFFLFSGIVSDVAYLDDGFTSTVTISCDDPLSLIARTALTAEKDFINNPKTIDEAIQFVTQGDFPAWGGLSGGFKAYCTPTRRRTAPNVEDPALAALYPPLEGLYEEGSFAGDAVKDLMTAEQGISLPVIIYCYNDAIPNPFPRTRFAHSMIARNWLYPGSGRQQTSKVVGGVSYIVRAMSFVEGTVGAHELPFRNPTVGFSIDSLVNTSSCTAVNGLVQQVTNQASVDTYGPRSTDFTDLAFGFDEDALDLATQQVTRYSSVSYGVTGLTVTGKMIRAHAPDTSLDEVNNLIVAPHTVQMLTDLAYSGYAPLDSYNDRVRGPLFFPTHVEFTGAGGVTLDSEIAFMRADYRITPDDWEVTLSDSRPATEAFGFVLAGSPIESSLDLYSTLGRNRLA